MYLGPNGICLNMDGLSIKEDMEKKKEEDMDEEKASGLKEDLRWEMQILYSTNVL